MMREMKLLPNSQANPEIVNNESETRTINFTITDGTDPVNGATVAIGNKTGTTGSAGGCSLTEIADGEHEVIVTCDGYTTKTETIVVSESDTAFTITLESA